MKKLLFSASFFLLTIPVFSQAYMTAGGLRLGTDWGLTLQQRVGKNTTVEGILQSSLQREEVIVTGLIERHYPIVFKGLNLYFGAGIHKGWLNEPARPEAGRDYNDPFGVSFVGGAELTLGRLNFSYDFKPAFNISGGEETFYTQTGISVRYVLLKNKVYKDLTKKKRKKKRQENGGIHIGDDWKIWKKKD